MTMSQARSMRILAHAALALICSATITVPVGSACGQSALHALHHETIAIGREPSKKIEYFWMAPPGKGPWSAIVFIHGYQRGSETPGGKAFGHAIPYETREREIEPFFQAYLK